MSCVRLCLVVCSWGSSELVSCSRCSLVLVKCIGLVLCMNSCMFRCFFSFLNWCDSVDWVRCRCLVVFIRLLVLCSVCRVLRW